MIRYDRQRCDHCERFMTLVDDVLPLHSDMDGVYCAGSDTEDYSEPRDCGCPYTSPPCRPCENNYVDINNPEPDPLLCENVKAASLCGVWCPLLMRGLCKTPELVAAPVATRADSTLLDLFGLDAPVEAKAEPKEPQWITPRRETLEAIHEAQIGDAP